jgi:polyisoprenoid-binding protein YceI
MAQENWLIDSTHSGVHFVVRHLVVTKVRGRFASWQGSIQVEDGDFARASVQVSIETASIETGVADRDGHLKSPDFFDVASYPTMTFQSRSVERQSETEFQLLGDLQLHGVTRDVVLAVSFDGKANDPWGNERAAFSAKTSLKRSDFGLTWNQTLETGGLLVSDRVDIELEIQAVRQKA